MTETLLTGTLSLSSFNQLTAYLAMVISVIGLVEECGLPSC